MGIVIAEQSMSLDGFSAGLNVDVGNGMGDGGEELHAWMEDDESAPILAATFESSGAAVVGRRMFDVGVDPSGDDPPFHMPVFVITHRPRDPIARKVGTTYNFVTGGIEAALSARDQPRVTETSPSLGAPTSFGSWSPPDSSTSCGSTWPTCFSVAGPASSTDRCPAGITLSCAERASSRPRPLHTLRSR